MGIRAKSIAEMLPIILVDVLWIADSFTFKIQSLVQMSYQTKQQYCHGSS